MKLNAQYPQHAHWSCFAFTFRFSAKCAETPMIHASFGLQNPVFKVESQHLHYLSLYTTSPKSAAPPRYLYQQPSTCTPPAHPHLFFQPNAALQHPDAVVRDNSLFSSQLRACLKSLPCQPLKPDFGFCTPRRRFSTVCLRRAPGWLRSLCRWMLVLFSSLGGVLDCLMTEVGFEMSYFLSSFFFWGGGQAPR